MQIQGIWRGKLYHPNLKNYIEGEFFQLEILPEDGFGYEFEFGLGLSALVTEEMEVNSLSPDMKKGKTVHLARGRLNTDSNSILLFYESKGPGGLMQAIELDGKIDIGNKTMTGTYSLECAKKAKVELSFHLECLECLDRYIYY